MAPLKPIYTPSNCRPAYQLNWSISLFWKQPESRADWLDALKPEVESDGVRLLQHRFLAPEISQFFVSTKPEVAPLELVRSVKGRLQHLIGERIPQAFRRNYGLRSIGAADRRALENYIASQGQRHPMADPRVEESLKAFQIHCPEADLSAPRRTAHAQYWHNLHIVLVNESRWRNADAERFQALRKMILKIARQRGHLLSRAAIAADHVHLALGCGIAVSPMAVALCYMNNLAYAMGMRPVFMFSYYVGTFGEYDRGVVGKGEGRA